MGTDPHPAKGTRVRRVPTARKQGPSPWRDLVVARLEEASYKAGMLVATHSGPFHCDDVFAFALLRCFLSPTARCVRTRDLSVIAEADIAIDVGGAYDPMRRRFDHHQRDYDGLLSSAGMVLSWLHAEGHVDAPLAQTLREQWVDYIDAVDNGRRKPESGVPCLPTVVGALCEQADTHEEFDARYLQAVDLCIGVIEGTRKGQLRTERARAQVRAAMDRAEAEGMRVLMFEERVKWKRAYFEHGGETHPTDFVVMPDGERWQLVAIPPAHDSFDKKRPLPEAWAGLVDDTLSQIVGVEGAKFCHKNRFIAIFATREATLAAMDQWGLARHDGIARTRA